MIGNPVTNPLLGAPTQPGPPPMPQLVPVDHDPFDPHGDVVRRLQALEAKIGEGQNGVIATLSTAVAGLQQISMELVRAVEHLRTELVTHVSQVTANIDALRDEERMERDEHIGRSEGTHQKLEQMAAGVHALVNRTSAGATSLGAEASRSIKEFHSAIGNAKDMSAQLAAVTNQVAKLTADYERMHTALTAPKRIVRDKDDRPIGVVIDHKLGA